MKSHLLFAILVTFCVLTPECKKGPSVTPEQSAQVRQTVVNYLECDECENGELESIVKLGGITVTGLAATLHEGPSLAKREVIRRGLIRNYRKLKEYEQTHPTVKVPGTEEQYVKTYLNDYVAGYQVKAAFALAAVGGAQAKQALEDASRKQLRTDVQAAITKSLEKMK